MEFEAVIGLEVHVQLLTKAKIFSGAATAYGAEPNSQACAIDLAMPGTLPVLNAKTIDMATKFALSIGATVAPLSVFARKNYFYPDLPKGYQISQFELPIVGNGSLNIKLEDGQIKRINIVRAHLEEDAGKSLHEDFNGMTGIDLNRAGVPLLEIVSAPELSSAKEAVAYLKTLHTLVRYLEISDGNMQEGSFRCDANVSIRPKGQKTLGTRAEIKNVNSFRFVERAINYEIARQTNLLESGGTVIQETRLYDADKNETRALRSKESANDYRYFPDPDLLPVKITEEFIATIRKTMPELPWEKAERFTKTLGLSQYDADILVADQDLANYFESVLSKSKISAKQAANWLIGEVLGALNKHNLTITKCPITPALLADLLDNIENQTISGKIAKDVFEAMWQGEGDAATIIKNRGLTQITDQNLLATIIMDIINNNPEQTAQYRAGKDKLFGYFVGQVMKATQGKANPEQVNKLLIEKLGE